MRTLFIILFIVFIGFGFLLSEHMDAQEELILLRQENTQLIEENKNLRNEMNLLKEKSIQNEQTITVLKRNIQEMADVIRRSNEESANLRNQIHIMQSRIEALQIVRSIQPKLPKLVRYTNFLPIIPVSMIASFILIRRSRGKYVRLTEDEIKKIVRMRRDKNGKI